MFIKDDLRYLDVGILKKLLKRVKIGYHKLKKNEMVEKYNIHIAVLKIQKMYRKHFYKNAVDHITLEKVEYPCFIFQTKSSKKYFYAYTSIIKYIMKTGDTRDPMTRTAYSDEILERLDSDVKKHYSHLKFKSTLKIKKIQNMQEEFVIEKMKYYRIKLVFRK